MDTEISTRDLARLLGVTEKTVALWAKSGVVARTAHGKFAHDASIQGFARHMRSLVAAKGGETAAKAVATERAALLSVQRKRAEFEFEKDQKLWMPTAEFERHIKMYTVWLRNEVMRIPTRMVGVDRSVMTQVDDEIGRILTEIANGDYDPPEIKGRRDHVN